MAEKSKIFLAKGRFCSQFKKEVSSVGKFYKKIRNKNNHKDSFFMEFTISNFSEGFPLHILNLVWSR